MSAVVLHRVAEPGRLHRLLWVLHPHPKYRLCSGDYYFSVRKTVIIILDTTTVSLSAMIPQPAELGKLPFKLIKRSTQNIYPSQVRNIVLPSTLDGFLVLG